MTDPAHILFPSDAPVSSQPPDWFKQAAEAATARLMRTEKPAADDATARMFPNEAQAAKAVDPNADTAEKLFPDDANPFDDADAKGFFNTFALSARSDGDTERAEALTVLAMALL